MKISMMGRVDHVSGLKDPQRRDISLQILKLTDVPDTVRMLSRLSASTRRFFRGLQTMRFFDRVRTSLLLGISCSPLGRLIWIVLGHGFDWVIVRDDFEVIALGFLALNDSASKSLVSTLGIVVSDKSQSKGIGSLLMKVLIERARVKGVKELSLEVDSCNAKAIALYRKFGFEGILKREEIVGKEFIDVLRMVLLI